MAGNTHATDVSQATFEDTVIRRSHQVPVVVDFWAPWCGPCRALGPVLERLAAAAHGAWELVKLNTDENQQLAQRYGIQSIPAVKGFRDGQVVAEFIGAQPEAAVRTFLQRLIPSSVDRLANEAFELAQAGDSIAAERRYQEALTEQPGHPKASLGLASILLDQHHADEALSLLSDLPVNSAEGKQAASLRGRAQFVRDAASSPTRDEAKRLLEQQPNDPEALWTAGVRAAADGDYREALERFLALVTQHRRFRDDAGRKAMIAVCDILGPEDQLTREFRPRLASALY